MRFFCVYVIIIKIAQNKYVKTKLKAEKQFLVLSTIIFLLIGATLILVLSQNIKKALVEDRQKILINLTNRQMESHLPIGIFSSSDHSVISDRFQGLLREISNNNVVRIKAYDPTGRIIFSDEPELIGLAFPSNQKLAKALGGETVNEIEDTDHEENVFEKKFPHLMEIYLPVKQEDRQVGVLELYYNLNDVYSTIEKIRLFIASISLSLLLILFASLYWIFKKTSDNLELSHIKEIENSSHVAKLKDEFVYLAAHELRAPATAIKGYIEMIEEKHASSNKKADYLNKIKEINSHLIDLINDLLEVARTESSKIKIDLSVEDLPPVVRQTIDKLFPLAKEKEIKINYLPSNDLPKVLANCQKLEEIITNLISNAIKYNHVGGKIEIRHELKDQAVITHVIDTGIGLTDEDKGHLFEKFWRADNDVVTSHTGTGLGLFITKELVERMHGKIWVESESGKGSTFSFQLPIAY